VDLQSYLFRILGWTNSRGVDHALRSLTLARSRQAALVITGTGDLVGIALSLHRRAFPPGPFILCDRKRHDTTETVRCPTNIMNPLDAFKAARHGSLCVRNHRLPVEFPAVKTMFQDSLCAVRLIVCVSEIINHSHTHALTSVPVPIRVPPLQERSSRDLDRIVEEYGADAISTLGVDRLFFAAKDHKWIVENAATSLTEVEKAALRLVAINATGDIVSAAHRLQMSPISLRRWYARREPQNSY